MGLFDFLKSKSDIGENNTSEKSLIKPNEQNEYHLTLSDFDQKTQAAQVISVSVSPDFYELFPEAEKPMKAGSKIKTGTRGTKLIFWGQPVDVNFDSNLITGDFDTFINKVNDQLNWLNKNKNQVEEIIVRDLLPMKNGDWLDDGEAPLNRETFLNSISLVLIQFDENAAISLDYDDRNTFFGHDIVVEISAERKINNAEIMG